jgi:hypothetical protein
MNIDDAVRMAEEDAETVIGYARDGGSNPIVWITGNSYMPPLRDVGQAETVWQADDTGELWEAYAETFEHALETAEVYLGAPEWDNALYVVDLQRFEYVESETGADLQDDWTAIS